MKIAVLGAGSWGSTLAVLLRQNHHDVTLWSNSAEDIAAMLATRSNADYLPGLRIPDDVAVTGDLDAAAEGKDMLVLSTPSQYLRAVLAEAAPRINDPLLVNVSKGIETSTLFRMSEVVADVLPRHDRRRYAVLSGPSHAEEVSVGKATSVVAASVDQATSLLVQSAFMTPYFRVYSSTDVIGVELGGSVKNVIAIGAGICDGADFGDNTKAALITRGIAEIRRLGVALGADRHTFAGLSGLGDLIVTTMSRHSRNRYVGEEIGRGRSLESILGGMKMVAEGVDTTLSTDALAERSGVEMPITRQMKRILFENKELSAAMMDLMTRQARGEEW